MTRNVLVSVFALFMVLLAGNSIAQSSDQQGKDDKILNDYFAKNNIKATKTPSGLYYVINRKGTGENAKPGQQVTMLYYGYFLDGKMFDGNMDKSYNPAAGKRPFTFPLGAGRVIRGWDEGVQLLNKGCRATLYLPSGIAYGPNGGGPIPPNSVLAFDVEVESIQ